MQARDAIWLGPELAEPGPPMSAERLRWCLEVLGWSSQELARRLAVNEKSARYWVAGRRPVPDSLAAWIEHLVAVMLQQPALPDGWADKPSEPCLARLLNDGWSDEIL